MSNEWIKELYAIHDSIRPGDYPLLKEVLKSGNHDVAKRFEAILQMALDCDWVDDWECDLDSYLCHAYGPPAGAESGNP